MQGVGAAALEALQVRAFYNFTDAPSIVAAMATANSLLT